jgi:pyrroline-5-carboxylate reductase
VNSTFISGTTAAAIYEMEGGKFRTVVSDGMWAAYRRSLEMGGNNSNVGPGRFNSNAGHSRGSGV